MKPVKTLVSLVFALFASAAVAAEPMAIEDAIANHKTLPEGKVMVHARILIHAANRGKKTVSAKFVDVKPSPNVNLEVWEDSLYDLPPETTVKVVGEFHVGPVKGGTRKIRYKVKEIGGRTYNDHRHWRTDRAVYIVNPVMEVEQAPAAPAAN